MRIGDRNKVGAITTIALPALLSSPSSTIPLPFFILCIQQLRERERERERERVKRVKRRKTKKKQSRRTHGFPWQISKF